MTALKKQTADDEKKMHKLVAAELKKNEANLKKQLAQLAKAEDKAYLEWLSFVERKAEVARRKIVSTAESDSAVAIGQRESCGRIVRKGSRESCATGR